MKHKTSCFITEAELLLGTFKFELKVTNWPNMRATSLSTGGKEKKEREQ